MGGVSGAGSSPQAFPTVGSDDQDEKTLGTENDAGTVSVLGDGGTATAAERARIAMAMDGYQGSVAFGDVVDAKKPNGLDKPLAGLPALPLPKLATKSMTGAELDQQIATAQSESKAGHASQAVKRLSAIMDNEALPPAQRARAAAALAGIVFTADPDTTRAEIALLEAKTLDPKLDVRRLDIELAVAQGRPRDALPLLDSLLKEPAHANDPGLWQMKANLLLATADRKGALDAIENALLLGKAAGVSPRVLVGMKLDYARMLFENQRPDDAVKQCQEVLAFKGAGSAQIFRAHYTISELLPAPAFGGGKTETAADRKGPNAKAINDLFEVGNRAFRAGDPKAMREAAEAILKLDPNDGLAHRMWAIAFKEEQRIADGTQIIGPLDTLQKRTALVKQLTDLCAQGKPGATPKDLFPEWDTLNEMQRASVAYSVLGYGSMIPLAVKAGMQYHFAGPGTSAAFLSDAAAPADANAYGRHRYVIRGWFDPDTKFVVTGSEQINAAAYGGRSTVAHEFGHLIHELCRQAHEVPAAKRTPEQQKMAAVWDQINTLFAEAKAKAHGQSFMDAYSSNNAWEYFAQATEAITNPNGEASRTLFTANPKMWHFVHDLIAQTKIFPSTVDAQIDHPPVGVDAAGSALELDRLASTSKKPAVRGSAAAIYQHLAALSFPATPPPPVGMPPKTAMPSVWRGDAIQLQGAKAMRDAALSGNFDQAIAHARSLSAGIEAGKYSPAELRDITSAYCDTLVAAKEKSNWSALEIFLSFITAGIAALFIHFLSKADAMETRDFIDAHRPERMWRGAGAAMAEAGGPALRDEHARGGDAALLARLRQELAEKNPEWSAAKVGEVAGFVLAGIKDFEHAHPSVPGHPDVGGLDEAGAAALKQTLLARGADLAAIESGAKPINYLSQPGPMIASMGLDELQGQTLAELARVQQLEAQPGLSAAKRSELADSKAKLLQLQTDLGKAKHDYADGSRSIGEWQADTAGFQQRLVALHTRVSA